MMAQMKTAQVRFIFKERVFTFDDRPSGVFWADYCEMSEMEGFNCMSEKLCVPQERVCDGYPDCVIGITVFDEMNCIPELGRATKTSILCEIKGLVVV